MLIFPAFADCFLRFGKSEIKFINRDNKTLNGVVE
jgi:hypothetical protein